MLPISQKEINIIIFKNLKSISLSLSIITGICLIIFCVYQSLIFLKPTPISNPKLNIVNNIFSYSLEHGSLRNFCIENKYEICKVNDFDNNMYQIFINDNYNRADELDINVNNLHIQINTNQNHEHNYLYINNIKTIHQDAFAKSKERTYEIEVIILLITLLFIFCLSHGYYRRVGSHDDQHRPPPSSFSNNKAFLKFSCSSVFISYAILCINKYSTFEFTSYNFFANTIVVWCIILTIVTTIINHILDEITKEMAKK